MKALVVLLLVALAALEVQHGDDARRIEALERRAASTLPVTVDCYMQLSMDDGQTYCPVVTRR